MSEKTVTAGRNLGYQAIRNLREAALRAIPRETMECTKEEIMLITALALWDGTEHPEEYLFEVMKKANAIRAQWGLLQLAMKAGLSIRLEDTGDLSYAYCDLTKELELPRRQQG